MNLYIVYSMGEWKNLPWLVVIHYISNDFQYITFLLILELCNPSCINGKCDNGVCKCNAGWTGSACSESKFCCNRDSESLIFADFNDVFYKFPVKVIMTFEWAIKILRFWLSFITRLCRFCHSKYFQFLPAQDIPKTRLCAVLIVSILNSNRKDVSSNHIKIQFWFKEVREKCFSNYYK